MIAQVSCHVTTIKLLLGDGAGQKSVFLFLFLASRTVDYKNSEMNPSMIVCVWLVGFCIALKAQILRYPHEVYGRRQILCCFKTK